MQERETPRKYLPEAPEIFVPEKINGSFEGKDVISVEQFEKEDLLQIFTLSRRMRDLLKVADGISLAHRKILFNLFYEPSTRTDSSFEIAMKRLGGDVKSTHGIIEFSSVTKGESLPDTARAVACYADVIAIRHYQQGSAATAAYFVRKMCEQLGKKPVPVINAGDGTGEHPTQALLDIFTIEDYFGHLEGLRLHVGMVGDLRFGRTVHSLAKLLAKFNDVRISFISPELLKAPPEVKAYLAEKGVDFSEMTDLSEVIHRLDVMYVTRVQKERFENPQEYEQVKNTYVVTPDILVKAKQRMIVMHPLPRVGEISYAVDHDPRAGYFRQMENGLYVRMALLAAVLGKIK